MTEPDEAFRTAGAVMRDSPFVTDLGIRLVSLGQGMAESETAIVPRLTQFNGYAHAGVVATIADQTAGAAASTCLEPSHLPLTLEFKINLLRPAVGDVLRCKATVLKAGQRIIVVESEVYGEREGGMKLVAKAIVSIAVVPDVAT